MTVTRIFTEEPEKRPDGSTAMCKKYLAEVDNGNSDDEANIAAGIISDLMKRYGRIYRIVKSESV